MHFSRLRLIGFKSFTDRSELHIEPGLTGVVGPNGCGKSNLLEAIRWVMGENRAKSLRGSGMEDVIFAGSTKRSPRHMAEVTLVLDNSDQSAPEPYTFETTLEVTRRIERDAGSAYRINGKDVRQKDVQLLFADAATGAHSPALVSQGRIGALINAKPADRRSILEDAAGISGLYTRRKDAESRLRAAEGNLTRLHDIMEAMDTQMASLKRQARQAERYREISTDIDQAEASLLYVRWAEAAARVHALEKEMHAHAGAVDACLKAVQEATLAQVASAESMPPLRTKLSKAEAEVHALELRREALVQEEKRRQHLAQSLRERLEQAASDIARESEQVSDAVAALRKAESEAERLASAAGDQADAEKQASEALSQAQAQLKAAEIAHDTLNEDYMATKGRRSSLESDMSALRRRLAQFAEDKSRAEREKTSLEAGNTLEVRKAEVTERIAQARAEIERLESEIDACETQVRAAREALSQTRGLEEEEKAGLRALEGEVQSLERLLAVKASQRPVAHMSVVSPGAEKAFAASLQAGAETGLAPNEADSEASGNWADAMWLAPITHGAAAPAPKRSAVCLNKLVIEAPSALSAVLAASYLLEDGALAHAASLQNVEGAQALARLVSELAPGQQYVDTDGRLLRWDGYFQSSLDSQAHLYLERRNRLAAASTALSSARARVSEHAAQRSQQQSAVTDLETRLKAAREARRASDKGLSEARAHLSRIEEDASRRAGRLSVLVQQLARLGEDSDTASTRLKAAEDEIASLPDTSGLEAALEDSKKALELARSNVLSTRNQLDSLVREREARASRLKVLAQEQVTWAERLERSKLHKQELEDRRSTTEKELKAVESLPSASEGREDAILEDLEAARAAKLAAEDALKEAESKHQSLEAAMRDKQDAHAQAREVQIRAEAAIENASDRRRELARLIGERFGAAPTQILEKVGLDPEASLPDRTVLEAQLDKFKRERERIGAVNLRAEEELAELLKESGHMAGERRDLEEAISRLRGAISGLNKEGRERLLKAFDVVNGHFTQLFTTLFGGGDAHLELVESDDPMEAGLEIFASPPGKKLQALSLLSGGEQALTATSLIFAVFMTNPSPICVLDEVDAPLDDANVDRFCDLLDAMVRQTDTRFLIVTHNAVTMSRMNRLFGVTMAERGVSTLVSVDLEKAEDLMAS